MKQFTAELITLVIAALWRAINAAEISCSGRPPPFINYSYCCRIPRVRIEMFPDQCKQFANSYFFGQNRVCGMECMFSNANALENTALNLDNVKSMLEEIYEDPDVAEAKYSSYEECSDLISNKLENSQRNGYGYQYNRYMGSQCSPIASIYALCAQIKMMKYCPQSAWLDIQPCRNTKEFVESCEERIFN